MVISVCWSHFPIPNSNEIKLSSFSSNAPPTFIRPHILTDKKKKNDSRLESFYQATKHSHYLFLHWFYLPFPPWQQECFMFSNIWVVFLSMLWVPSSSPSQEFYIIAFSFPLLYSQPLSLNPSKWLFSICRSLPLKQNTCLSNYCSISPSNAKLLKNLSVLTISQLILYPF